MLLLTAYIKHANVLLSECTYFFTSDSCPRMITEIFLFIGYLWERALEVFLVAGGGEGHMTRINTASRLPESAATVCSL